MFQSSQALEIYSRICNIVFIIRVEKASEFPRLFLFDGLNVLNQRELRKYKAFEEEIRSCIVLLPILGVS